MYSPTILRFGDELLRDDRLRIRRRPERHLHGPRAGALLELFLLVSGLLHAFGRRWRCRLRISGSE
jgi:hypothetical protein